MSSLWLNYSTSTVYFKSRDPVLFLKKPRIETLEPDFWQKKREFTLVNALTAVLIIKNKPVGL